jgi:phenylalanyl-tRNA synthetase alpha chain
MLKERIVELSEVGKRAFAEAEDAGVLGALETEYLGRKSELGDILKGIKDLSPEEKKTVGPLANEARRSLEMAFVEAKTRIESASLGEEEWIDVTAPGKVPMLGHLHPITRIEHEIEDIFTRLGFEIADGPEVEKEFYNFDALNVPKNHPARDMQDTFWVKPTDNRPARNASRIDAGGQPTTDDGDTEKYVMRTQTSSVQVRYMEEHTPPYRIVIPGRIFRNEATDASHEHTFHQFECLMVGGDGQVTVAHFKHVAGLFFREFFSHDVTLRLRPSFFPFTEPSFEFDISCMLCDGKGCPVCKQTGWLEVGGAGMVNQKVFEAAGYERGKYQGFAWGFGLTRLAMMKYKVGNIRSFMSGDLRFTRQF